MGHTEVQQRPAWDWQTLTRQLRASKQESELLVQQSATRSTRTSKLLQQSKDSLRVQQPLV
jgi:hypothetical protein